MNKHDHCRDETETGLHLTRKAPDITVVRSFSKEVRVAPDVQFAREHQPVVRRARVHQHDQLWRLTSSPTNFHHFATTTPR